MTGEDRDVLELLGQKGKSPEEIGERFPGFDMLRLVRAGLVEEQHIELAETQAHGDMSPSFIRHYMLTERGARAVGIDPLRLGLAYPPDPVEIRGGPIPAPPPAPRPPRPSL